jgi:hypothetical protein
MPSAGFGATFCPSLNLRIRPVADNILRPRTATELVDGAVQLLRRHYVSFIMVSGIGMAPLLLLRPFLTRLMGGEGTGVQVAGVLSGLVIMIVTSIWYSLAGAAIIAAAAQGYTEGHIDVGAAISRVGGRVPAVLYASFTKSIAIGLGFFLFLVGSVYFYATYFALPTTVMIEDLDGHKGVERAKQLAEGHRWAILKPLALVFVIYLVIFTAGGAVSGMLFGPANTLATDLLSTIVTILVYPIVPITEMLVYFDLRIRNEGYDVEVMASKLDPPGTAPA